MPSSSLNRIKLNKMRWILKELRFGVNWIKKIK